MTELSISRIKNLVDKLNDTPDRPVTCSLLADALVDVITALDQIKEDLDG